MTTTTAAPERTTYRAQGAIAIDRWPSEGPLFALALTVSTLIWILLVVSVIGIVYAALFGVFFFVMHVGFVAHVRGNGVRLGPDQFPALHDRVTGLAQRLGLKAAPDAYLIQAGGSLNALATRFLRSNMVILYSDLLEACGDDHAARDMIIGHELGHIRAGHLRWHWYLLPASVVPFLGSALSRAREYTCDRYGLACAMDRDAALLGLAILAAGGSHARDVNRRAMVRQRADLNTGWMTLGEWLASHPPLAKRLVALDPDLGAGQRPMAAGPVRALSILFGLGLLMGGGATGAAVFVGKAAQMAAEEAGEEAGDPLTGAELEAAQAELAGAVADVSAFLDAEVAAGRGLPEGYGELSARWQAAFPGRDEPTDPFDGAALGYTLDDDGTYTLWSSGPDGIPGTDDDLYFPSED